MEFEITGGIVLIDDSDYEWVSKYRWHIAHGYAVRTAYGDGIWHYPKTVSMHREILFPDGSDLIADHKNMNPLDNRRSNLRPATRSQNNMNKKCNHGKKLPKGVSFHKRIGRYMARISVMRKTYNLGYFDTAEEAFEVYKKHALIIHGEYCRF